MDENPYQSPETIPEPRPPDPYSFEKKLFWGLMALLIVVLQQVAIWWLAPN